MFFTIFLIFFRIAPTTPSGKVNMPKRAAVRSAPRYPRRSSQGLTAQKYRAPPTMQKAAPSSRTCPPQALWDQTNSAPVAASQNSKSSTGPSSGTRTRTRKMRNRS